MTAPTTPAHYAASPDPRFSILTVELDETTGKVWHIHEEPVICWRVTDAPAPDPAGDPVSPHVTAPLTEPVFASLGLDPGTRSEGTVYRSKCAQLGRYYFLRYPTGRIESLYEPDVKHFAGLKALLRTLDIEGLAADRVQLLDPEEWEAIR